jgi:hypothetical protein
MLHPRARGLWALSCLAACDLLGGGGPPDANPPAPPLPEDLPAELVEALPRTEDGLPVVQAVESFGLRVQVAYDAAKDDAVARWGQCVSRVAACHRANPGAQIAGCIDQIERCPDDTGGRACCPPRCIADFLDVYADTGDETQAIEETILHGACVEGFPVDDEVTP